MPNYDYECEKCGKQFEVFQKMSDAPLTSCPSCGGHVHKCITEFAVSFKGSGFYVNDKNVRNQSSKKSGCSGKSCSGCSGCA